MGQRGYATDFGKAPHYMPLRWDGTAWDFETEFIPGQTASVHPCPSTTTFSTLGMTVVLTGTATAADVTDSSAIYPRAPRVDILGAGIAAIRENVTRYFRGGGSNRGGFFVKFRFGIRVSPYVSTIAYFGLRSNTGAPTDVNPSTNYNNLLGFGYDSGDSTWSFMHRTGSATAAKVAFSGWSKPSADTVYEAIIFCAQAGSEVRYALRNLTSPAEVADKVNSSLPADTTTLSLVLYSSVASAPLAQAGISLMGLYARTFD